VSQIRFQYCEGIGTETVHIRGWKWLDNDWVNIACSAFGVVIAFLFV